MSRPIADRFKAYEAASEQILPARLPVLVRLDGNSFSSLTRALALDKPFDERFERAMEAAALALMDYCSGAQIAFLQSDEISILLRNDQKHETQAFLGNRTQKLASLLAATASVAFGDALGKEGIEARAVFDCRTFVVPPADVTNCFVWRQQDAFRNCIQSVAHYGLRKKHGRKTARKMLYGRPISEQVEIIRRELDTETAEVPAHRRLGRTIVRERFEVPLSEVMPEEIYRCQVEAGEITEGQTTERSRWALDRNPPRFSEDPSYIERLLS